jgi:diguanylate cyclase (GGDEF)-like protein
LAQAIRKAPAGPAPAFGLLFIDCDRFKLINDSLGHQVGDQLLITLGQRLAGTVRPTDTLARLGGDEFAVLVENLSSASEVLAIAERIHAAFEPAVDLADSQVVVTVSIGVALDLPEGGSPIDMLRDADTAMYRAKADGRGRTVVFDGTMHREVVRRLKTETDLRRAIDRGELRVYYQPICRLADRSIAGFEALVRWQRDDGGLVAPGDFIPIAEETGLIEPIGEWVLVEACRQVEAWRRARHQDPKDLFVSVNLSPVQLSRGDMVKRIDAIVTASGLPAGNLKLEVTETAFMTSAEGARVMLRALAERGIRLSIDDFGTGYSSLSLLHSFPFDTLKIDRSFVARLNSTREHSEIVRTILMLGRSLHLSVVAEGVETSAQCEWLLASGCPYAQGHLFSRPVPVDAAERLLLSQRGCWPGDLTGDRLCA